MNERDRITVAKEAGRLLYHNLVEDYKSAKEIACDSLGIKALPSNFEVSRELDKLANEIEGTSRIKLLIDMRKKALQIMDNLASFTPKLVGSVWRGTLKKGSDIDIAVYSESSDAVVNFLKNRYTDVRTEYKSKTARGTSKTYFHIYFTAPNGYEVEVVVRSPEEMYEVHRCDFYGDTIVGLTRQQLRRLLERDATKRFVPEERKDWWCN